ncbi:MAG: hypothetical protein K2N63_05105, partial [Lachnospiraceae bacterium]|nr:hypothetical protein [Lachnospiraceae bacterium]
MKVAYWGNGRKSGVTCALTAIGLTAVLSYPFKITLFENHYNENGVLRYLFPRKWQYCVGESVYRDPVYKTPVYGNYLTHQACAVREGGDGSEAYPVIELLEKGLYYVPQFASNADLFDYQFHCDLLPLLKRYQEIAFIDTHRENTISSKIILEDADIVVVLLRQDMDEIQS